MLGFPKNRLKVQVSSALCKVSGLVQSSRNQSRVLGLTKKAPRRVRRCSESARVLHCLDAVVRQVLVVLEPVGVGPD